ncbi:hypothetical protein Taro_035134 [Colocasia esculenta]|uniref:Uncharacterized protein n=1 Tax=Colocasia esculenta TaxID=4460 RepID=A0A843W5S6_COLES|nr:hypothetical protein [Colocasia esculenta]
MNYPGSDLLSTGVLRPVPEQQLRIPLPKGTVPFMDTYTPSRSWSSLHNQKRKLQHPRTHQVFFSFPEIVAITKSL